MGPQVPALPKLRWDGVDAPGPTLCARGAACAPNCDRAPAPLSFQVPNRIDSNLDEVLNVELPISERKSFSPAKVAQNVPQLRALLMMRKLLVEAMSNIDNRRALRRLIQETYQSPEALQTAREALAAYSGYRLPTPSATLPPPAAPSQLPSEGSEPAA